jgi:hypothetical protein
LFQDFPEQEKKKSKKCQGQVNMKSRIKKLRARIRKNLNNMHKNMGSKKEG